MEGADGDDDGGVRAQEAVVGHEDRGGEDFADGEGAEG